MVGRIGRAHGIRGEVVIGVHTDEPDERFAPGSVFDTDRGPLTVQTRRWHSSQLLVRFEGVADRNAAEELRGIWLGIDGDTLPPLDDPDEFRDQDLEGLDVLTTDGRSIGKVNAIQHLGQDVLEVQTPDGRSLLVPFVKAIVPEVDLTTRRILIDPPPGLLDLDL
jgi:16S rRNA processing protein RimM